MEKTEKKASEVKEVTGELVGWENNKIVRTLVGLTKRPGEVIDEYCRDKTTYLSPVLYFFSVTAIELYLLSASGLRDYIINKSVQDLEKNFAGTDTGSSGVDIASVVDQYHSLFSFVLSETGQKVLLMPLVLVITWLLYRRHRRGLKDNAWFALYSLAHITLLSLPLMLVFYFTKSFVVYTSLALVVAMVYWVRASMPFYRISAGRAIALRVVMLVGVFLLLQIITFLFILGAVIYQVAGA